MNGVKDSITTILIADPEFAATVPILEAVFPEFKLICATGTHDAHALASSDVNVLITQSVNVDEELLTKLTNLQIVLKLGRSYHNVDVEAVRRYKLTFACVPRKGPNCVAELALTFIMSLSKDLLTSHESVATGAYRYRGIKPEITAQQKMAFHWMKNNRVHEVIEKTLGIIGMGEIGCELARRTSVMGMRNIYYKRTPLSPELEERFDAKYADLDTLLSESDYVCVATPHTPETERMIGADQIALMKETAFIVNIARGGIIHEEAMIDALQENRIAGAGLDVFTYEPLHGDSPLCTMDNVILTPHIGGGTGTNRTIELTAALKEVNSILSGAKPKVDVN